MDLRVGIYIYYRTAVAEHQGLEPLMIEEISAKAQTESSVYIEEECELQQAAGVSPSADSTRMLITPASSTGMALLFFPFTLVFHCYFDLD